jgi:hypothetical protein
VFLLLIIIIIIIIIIISYMEYVILYGNFKYTYKLGKSNTLLLIIILILHVLIKINNLCI